MEHYLAISTLRGTSGILLYMMYCFGYMDSMCTHMYTVHECTCTRYMDNMYTVTCMQKSATCVITSTRQFLCCFRCANVAVLPCLDSSRKICRPLRSTSTLYSNSLKDAFSLWMCNNVYRYRHAPSPWRQPYFKAKAFHAWCLSPMRTSRSTAGRLGQAYSGLVNDLARVAVRELYVLHDLAHVVWVGSVLCASSTAIDGKFKHPTSRKTRVAYRLLEKMVGIHCVRDGYN